MLGQRNDTNNESIFHMMDGMQGVYCKMLGAVRILFLVSSVHYMVSQKSYDRLK